MQDYIAMALIWFATDQKRNAAPSLPEEAMSEKLQSLETLIDRVLK